jgi:PII-like signaling protein
MKREGEQGLLRIQLSSLVQWHHRPLYEVLVKKARASHLAGATVLAGHTGYIGAGRLLHEHVLALYEDRPIVVEMVDEVPALERFLEEITPLLPEERALVTLERAHVVLYRKGDFK